MAGRADGDASGEVEEAITIDIFDHCAIPAINGQWIDAGVRRRRVLFVGRN
jgi:hypothetical protein